jgi:hypothetical protein
MPKLPRPPQLIPVLDGPEEARLTQHLPTLAAGVIRLRRHAGPLIVGAIMGGLVWGVAADVITSEVVFLILILNFPAFVVALAANGNVHNPNNVVWVLASAAQWTVIASLLVPNRGRQSG